MPGTTGRHAQVLLSSRRVTFLFLHHTTDRAIHSIESILSGSAISLLHNIRGRRNDFADAFWNSGDRRTRLTVSQPSV